MTFDDELRRAFDKLASQLHDELSRKSQTLIDELATAARTDRDHAVTSAREEADADREQVIADVREQSRVEREQAVADARQQAIAEAAREFAARQPPPAPEPAPPSAPAIDTAARERLAGAVRAMDEARTLSEILDALVAASAHEVDRVGVLIARDGGYTGWQSVGFDPAFIRGEAAEPPADATTIPLEVGGQLVSLLCFDTTNAGIAGGDTGTSNPAVEILARHAARCLESVTAFKAARAALVRPRDRADEIIDESATDEDAAARRYARLLVSEIKLYHEPEVVAGRRERDLATRLGGEIARARVLYEQRVQPAIRARTDYFQDELIRTLANGDPTLLQLT